MFLIGPLAVIALAAWGDPRIAYAKVIEKDPRCVCRACRETVHPSRSFLNRHSCVSYRDVTQGERASLIFSIIHLVVLNILCEVRVPVPARRAGACTGNCPVTLVKSAGERKKSCSGYPLPWCGVMPRRVAWAYRHS